MKNRKQIGTVSFSEEAYDNFVSLSKEEQVKYIGERLSPKSERRATLLLKGVKHGDSTTNSGKSTKSNAASTGGTSGADSTEGQRGSDKKS